MNKIRFSPWKRVWVIETVLSSRRVTMTNNEQHFTVFFAILQIVEPFRAINHLCGGKRKFTCLTCNPMSLWGWKFFFSLFFPSGLPLLSFSLIINFVYEVLRLQTAAMKCHSMNFRHNIVSRVIEPAVDVYFFAPPSSSDNWEHFNKLKGKNCVCNWIEGLWPLLIATLSLDRHVNAYQKFFVFVHQDRQKQFQMFLHGWWTLRRLF